VARRRLAPEAVLLRLMAAELGKHSHTKHSRSKYSHSKHSHSKHSSSSSLYQIPNTEHMAYGLVRTLVYKRGVGIRETVWVIKCGRWS